MSAPQEQFQAFLALQRADYRRTLPDKLAQLQSLWTAVAAQTAAPALVDLERMAHTLAGTAGTMGFREVGLAARALEEIVARAGQTAQVLTPAQRSEISLALAAVRGSLPRD